ncbi:MAG: ATP-binding protein [Rikenellaceae bacterium]|nr:ATP-binding protein [Rikenellaceae bacterium]
MAKLIGRKFQIQELNERYDSDRAELVVVYGRRRVGKTFLVRETFKDRITFYHTGLSPYDENRKIGKKEQLEHFYHSLLNYGLQETACPKDWMEAFYMLEKLLSSLDDGRAQLVFIDELPWMDTPGSRFLTAFEAFWNGWASARDNIKCIVCGSATSWMADNMINNHGGLYGRQTCEIKLSPFTLNECEEFFTSRGIELTRYDITEIYMAVGGIPYYLDKFKKGLSVAQNIDRLFFAANAPLKNEFTRLFASLFSNPDLYAKAIRKLASRHYGFSRTDIGECLGIKSGAGLTKILNTLEASDFIICYRPLDAAKGEKLYRLTDAFCLFYLRFADNSTNNDSEYWVHNQNLAATNSWRGIAFEDLCISHIAQIKKALGISGVATTESALTLRGDESNKGTQMDLVIERKDRVVNLCEIKFYNGMFEIGKDYDLVLRNRMNILSSYIKKRQAIHLTIISTFGIKSNKYSGIVQNQITLDDLFL